MRIAKHKRKRTRYCAYCGIRESEHPVRDGLAVYATQHHGVFTGYEYCGKWVTRKPKEPADGNA